MSPQAWEQACGHVRTEAAVGLLALFCVGALLALVTCLAAQKSRGSLDWTVFTGAMASVLWLFWLVSLGGFGSKRLANVLYPEREAARYLEGK